MYKLSIITINLNNASGLKRTIESVLEQDYECFEFLIIDGGSTDESIEVIKSYTDNPSNKYFEACKQINFWLSENDDGVYHAMNKGIDFAKGEYLQFLNSGDFLINRNVLSEIFKESPKADIILTSCNITKENKIVHTLHSPSTITFGTLYFQGIGHQSSFIKKSIFKKFGYYDDSFKYNGDIEFWYRTIILNGVSTEVLPVLSVSYNLEGMSMTDNQKPEFKTELDRIFKLKLLEKFVPDYENWKKKEQDMKIMYWAYRKKILKFIINLSFNLSSFIRSKIS